MVRAAIAASLTSGKTNIAAALGDVILHGAKQAKHPWAQFKCRLEIAIGRLSRLFLQVHPI